MKQHESKMKMKTKTPTNKAHRDLSDVCIRLRIGIRNGNFGVRSEHIPRAIFLQLIMLLRRIVNRVRNLLFLCHHFLLIKRSDEYDSRSNKSRYSPIKLDMTEIVYCFENQRYRRRTHKVNGHEIRSLRVYAQHSTAQLNPKGLHHIMRALQFQCTRFNFGCRPHNGAITMVNRGRVNVNDFFALCMCSM